MIAGAAVLASSYTVGQLIAGRIMTGVGNGLNSSTAPVYQGECSPARIRGALLTLQGTVTVLGVVIAYWRFPLAFQAVFAALLARRVIAAINGRPVDDPDVGRTILDIQSGLAEEQRLLLTISVQLGQQFSGSNMINYYAPVIFTDSMGLGRQLSLILGGCAQCTYLVGSAIPVLLMDRYARRTLLIVAWFYPTEINTTRVRSRMLAIASGWNWMAVFAVMKITPIAFANIGWRTFIISAGLSVVFIPMVHFFYPETKVLELEDLPFLFHKGGVTGGVFSSRGRTITPGQHMREVNLDMKTSDEAAEEVERGV
ncbi:hypothetical protein DL765_005070 [Monosporascus sp. GIB2]|nr:hypothetical protein DL765_005070 [Monosporascus sp. GIB2]